MAKISCAICRTPIKMSMTRYTTTDKFKICKNCGDSLNLTAISVSKMSLSEIEAKKREFSENASSSAGMSCPSCNSSNVSFMQNKKKSFSVGKAIGGAVLTGGIGAVAGFAGKKGKNEWHCQNCGKIFETKK